MTIISIKRFSVALSILGLLCSAELTEVHASGMNCCSPPAGLRGWYSKGDVTVDYDLDRAVLEL
jgi:hypothetical protein